MQSDLALIFEFVVNQWGFTPRAFKDAVVTAALAKFVLSVSWWSLRYLADRFPANQSIAFLGRVLNTDAAKVAVLILDVSLIDVFLFFAVVSITDLFHPPFSSFSLWCAALFSLLLVYMLRVTYRDLERYREIV